MVRKITILVLLAFLIGLPIASAESVRHNSTAVFTDLALNFKDSTGVKWAVTEDSANGQVTAEPSIDVPTVKVTYTATSALDVTDQSETPVPFAGEEYDSASMHNATDPTYMTAPVAGIYRISATIEFNTSHGTSANLRVSLKNGGQYLSLTDAGTSARNDTFVSISTEAQLSAGAHVEVYCYQNSGSTVHVAADGAGYNHAEMTYVRPPVS